jgi:hypothetical protein
MSNLSTLLPAGASGKTFDATASGAIVTKKPVVLNSAGTVSQAALETVATVSDDFKAGSDARRETYNYSECGQVAWDSGDTDKFIYLFMDNSASRVIKGWVGTVSNSGGSTSISMGTTVNISGTQAYCKGFCADPFNAGKFLLFYALNDGTGAGNNDCWAVVLTINGTSITVGTKQQFDNEVYIWNYTQQVCADPNVENRFVAVWHDMASPYEGYARVITLASGSGTTMTFGTELMHIATKGQQQKISASTKNPGKFLVNYNDTNNYGSSVILTAGATSGTTLTVATPTVFASRGIYQSFTASHAWNPDVADQFLLAWYSYGTNVGYSTRSMFAMVGTLGSNDALTYGTETQFAATGESQMCSSMCAVGGLTNKFLVNWVSTGGSYTGDVSQSVGTITDVGGVTFGTRSITYYNYVYAESMSVASDPNNYGRCVTGTNLYESGNSETMFITEVGGTYKEANLTATNFLGFADAAISNSASGTVVVRGGTVTGLSNLTLGSKYYVKDDGSLTSPTAPVAYTIDGATYDSVSFTIGNSEGTPTGMCFNGDGTKMYVVGEVTDAVYQYSLSTAYDLSTASNDSVSLSVSSQLQPAPRSVVFNNDGTALYVCGPDDGVFQYTLSTAYNLATASYANKTFNVTTQEAYPCELIFNSDGTSMYTVGSQNDTVYQYTLSTAFDVSTASYASKSMSASDGQTSPTGLSFNSDGTKIFVSGETTPKINQYSLSTAYDVSTGSFDSISYTYTQGGGVLRNITFNGDGTKFYLVDSGTDIIYQYTAGGGTTSSTVAGLAISTTALLLNGDS